MGSRKLRVNTEHVVFCLRWIWRGGKSEEKIEENWRNFKIDEWAYAGSIHILRSAECDVWTCSTIHYTKSVQAWNSIWYLFSSSLFCFIWFKFAYNFYICIHDFKQDCVYVWVEWKKKSSHRENFIKNGSRHRNMVNVIKSEMLLKVALFLCVCVCCDKMRC